MSIKPLLVFIIALSPAGFALAQSAPKQPLNLELPPSDLAAPASSAHAPAQPAGASSTARSTAAQPGMYYGDTSGSTDGADARGHLPPCDDSTYNTPQVHGSVGMGVIGGNHVSGNEQSARMRISQAFGSCTHPTGHISISVGVSQSHVDGGRPPR